MFFGHDTRAHNRCTYYRCCVNRKRVCPTNCLSCAKRIVLASHYAKLEDRNTLGCIVYFGIDMLRNVMKLTSIYWLILCFWIADGSLSVTPATVAQLLWKNLIKNYDIAGFTIAGTSWSPALNLPSSQWSHISRLETRKSSWLTLMWLYFFGRRKGRHSYTPIESANCDAL